MAFPFATEKLDIIVSPIDIGIADGDGDADTDTESSDVFSSLLAVLARIEAHTDSCTACEGGKAQSGTSGEKNAGSGAMGSTATVSGSGAMEATVTVLVLLVGANTDTD